MTAHPPSTFLVPRPATLAALAIAAALGGCSSSPAPVGSVAVRVNQVGFAATGPKRALAMTQRTGAPVRFAVVDASGRTAFESRGGGSCSPWGRRWRGCQVLDFGSLRTPGQYRVRVGAVASPPFKIGSPSSVYGPLASAAVSFFQAQRDGPNVLPGPLRRAPAHRSDASATVYRTPTYHGSTLAGPLRSSGRRVDVSGGWFDAGDYLKFSGTASFSDVLLLFTLRDYGANLPGRAALEREARFGTDWLLKTWDRRRGVLYEQVGMGDGNGNNVLGDHDIWRLPQRDDRYRAPSLRYIAHRPVFAANRPGQPVSPNLAGRQAAAFALCAQVFRLSDPAYAHRCLLAGQTLYAAAATHWRGRLDASVPPAYYSEPEWRDDMELAAIELYLATLHIRTSDLPHREPYDYVEPAATWANAYMSARTAGQDVLNLYDVASLAHYDLYRVMVATGTTTSLQTNAADILRDLRDQLRLGVKLARRGPLGLADQAGTTDTVAHALGYALEARLYHAVTGDSSFEALARGQLDWVLGANPWGSSFVVGAGSIFPHCPAHQVANLSGSLNGTAPVLAGAVVAGPSGSSDIGSLGAPSGYRPCPARGDPYRALDAGGFRYLDDVRSPATSEPADDFTALSLAAFAQEAAGAPRAARLVIPK